MVSFSDIPLNASLWVSITKSSTLSFAKAKGSIRKYMAGAIAHVIINFFGTLNIYFK
jgi:hypothetical protein